MSDIPKEDQELVFDWIKEIVIYAESFNEFRGLYPTPYFLVDSMHLHEIVELESELKKICPEVDIHLDAETRECGYYGDYKYVGRTEVQLNNFKRESMLKLIEKLKKDQE